MDITSAQEGLAVLLEGSKNRIVAGHKLNAESSRSHMLVMLKIVQTRIDGSFKSSMVNFGDLAGSEDIKKAHGNDIGKKNKKKKSRRTMSKLDQRKMAKEAIGINVSLSALTRVINKLSEGKNPSYRDSKLTYVLKDSLGGNSKTTLLVCVSPHIFNRSETKRTLVFAATAKKVENKAKINETLSVKQLQKMIDALKAENTKLRAENTILQGKVKNLTGRGTMSVVNLLNDVPSKVSDHGNSPTEPSIYKQFSSQPIATNRSRIASLAYQPFSGRDRVGSSIALKQEIENSPQPYGTRDRHDSNASDDIALTGNMSQLQSAISTSHQEMEQEANNYMDKIRTLTEELDKQIQKTQELDETNNGMQLQLDKSDETINGLQKQVNDRNESCRKMKLEIDDYKKQIASLNFRINEYKNKFPNYRCKTPDSSDLNRLLSSSRDLKPDNSDLSDVATDDELKSSPPQHRNSGSMPSMDLQQIEMLQEYLKKYHDVNSSKFDDFQDQITKNFDALPEIQEELQQRYNRAEKYFENFDRKQNDLKSQMQSMKYILTQFIDKQEKQWNIINEDETDNDEDTKEDDKYSIDQISDDDDVNDRQQSNEQIVNDIQNSNSSCWSLFYCNNKKQQQQDINMQQEQQRRSTTKLRSSSNNPYGS